MILRSKYILKSWINGLGAAFCSVARSHDENLQLRVVIWIGLFVNLFYYTLTNDFYLDDGPSYRNALNWIEDGSIDVGRTPVYPLLLAFIRLFVEDPWLTHVVVFLQISLFFLSIPCFRYIAYSMTQSNRISFFMSLAYVCCPAIVYWNRCTMTESLAITGIVFLLYLFFRYRITKEKRCIVGSGIVILGLVMLRPANLYLFPVALLFWLYVGWSTRQWRDVVLGMGVLALCGITVGMYANEVEKKTGVCTLTTVSVINQFVSLRQADLIDCQTDFPVAKWLSASSGLTVEEECAALFSQYECKEVQALVSHSMRLNYRKWLEVVLSRVQENGKKYVFIPGGFKENGPLTIGALIQKGIVSLNIPFIQLYIFVFLYCLIGLYYVARHKKQWEIPVFLGILVCAHLFMIFIGAYGQYSRLFAPVYPVVILMSGFSFAYIFQMIKK